MGRAVVLAAAQQLGGQVTVLPIELLQDKRRLWARQLCVGFLNPVSSPLVMSVPRAGKKGHTAWPPHLRRGWMRAGQGAEWKTDANSRDGGALTRVQKISVACACAGLACLFPHSCSPAHMLDL